MNSPIMDPKQDFLELNSKKPCTTHEWTYTWWNNEYVRVGKCPHISISLPLHVEAISLLLYK